ncbi:hypothetical protein LOD99_12677 [Oopsacas minuta]|uniref:Major facilitator superfamily (MFS) profile domain-containing protein n=1 Tax=Oopsacas minuta TaxID=111878 RepID=A0AAV7JDB1_9METZ|nr:hypothetical protein LOD99_12677 [Oopsacas minuta]
MTYTDEVVDASYGAIPHQSPILDSKVQIPREYSVINESVDSNSVELEENKSLLGNLKLEPEFKPRKSIIRFYILLLFCGFTFMQGLIWNNWGPIADSAEIVYKWDSGGSVIALLTNLGPIAFVPGFILFPIIMNLFGLRYGILLGMLLTCIGAVMRIFTTSYPAATIIMYIAHFLNGLAGPASMGASTTISANWFPYNERTLATGIGGASVTLGVAISFIIGPLMVRQVNSTNITSTELSEVTTDIYHMLYVLAGVCVILFLLMLVYYPSKPKYPPSITAEEQRSNFIQTFRQLLTNVSFWIIFLCYGIATGVCSAWSGFLYPNLSMLKSIKVTQVYVGWLGFYLTLAGVTSTIVTGMISDRLPRWKKSFLITAMVLAGITALLFTLFCNEMIKVGNMTYFVITLTGILLKTFVNSTIGIYYELSAELGYPVPEVTSTTVLTLANNLAGFVFLLLAQFPQLGTSWMNWCQAIAFFIVIPLLLFTPIRYNRLNKDIVVKGGTGLK